MATSTETDASRFEYETFAPAGETCPACMRPVKTLERCRRGTLTKPGGPDVVVYRHMDCDNPQALKQGRRQ
ncbi:hypothetical protein [Streptomyces virginiae]|uniref:hypothetical protein n=1 Tax=Streptomyces virginiae TaxID=1961 RepID=UPI0033341F6F